MIGYSIAFEWPISVSILKDHTDTFEKMVCSSPIQESPKSLNASIECPNHCKIHEVNTKQFSINARGAMTLNSTHLYSNVRKDILRQP